MNHATKLLAVLLCGLAPQLVAQRVYVNSIPTNLTCNWSQVVTLPDPVQPDTFLALMPISAIPQWATWDGDLGMDLTYGAGNWLRCRMTALQWAYLSPSACAHLPAAGATAPLSLLTTSYDYGAFWGSPGQPLIPDATQFANQGLSYIDGSSHPMRQERWQLRSSGFFFEPWNACAGGFPSGPNFGGWLAVRMHYQFL